MASSWVNRRNYSAERFDRRGRCRGSTKARMPALACWWMDRMVAGSNLENPPANEVLARRARLGNLPPSRPPVNKEFRPMTIRRKASSLVSGNWPKNHARNVLSEVKG
jgi:hypothetical protein